MPLKVDWKVNLKTDGVVKQIEKATAVQLIQFAQEIGGDAKKRSPVAAVKGGTNKRSITVGKYEGADAVFTTSGYGGYLETGTTRMPARPYLYPAFEWAKRNVAKKIFGNMV